MSSKELRHEQLINFGAQADSDAGAEFRNDSSVTLSIISIDYSHTMDTAALNEAARVELSKSPVMSQLTANNPFWSYGQSIARGFGEAVDGAVSKNGGKSWDKGQLTLEPGESIFLNIDVTGAPTIDANYEVSYEF